MFCQRKIKENTKYIETEGLLKEKDQNWKKKIQWSTNHQTKENVLNQIKKIESILKISINIERNLRETRAITAIKKNPKYFYKFIKKLLNDQSWIGSLQDEEGNLEPSNKKISELLNQQHNNCVFSSQDPTMTIKYPKDFFGHP